MTECTNTPYQVLVWEKYEYKEQLGQPAHEINCDTEKEAYTEFNKVKKFMCKMIMKYASLEPDADGDVLEEEWKE